MTKGKQQVYLQILEFKLYSPVIRHYVHVTVTDNHRPQLEFPVSCADITYNTPNWHNNLVSNECSITTSTRDNYSITTS